ncbi:hypothetical protein C3L29_012240 [Pseudomonas sp. MWU12-2534b]|nr:hypothetical protein C3L29_012240 [Pseudomonas sp. MWU12-2534b]
MDISFVSADRQAPDQWQILTIGEGGQADGQAPARDTPAPEGKGALLQHARVLPGVNGEESDLWVRLLRRE